MKEEERPFRLLGLAAPADGRAVDDLVLAASMSPTRSHSPACSHAARTALNETSSGAGITEPLFRAVLLMTSFRAMLLMTSFRSRGVYVVLS